MIGLRRKVANLVCFGTRGFKSHPQRFSHASDHMELLEFISEIGKLKDLERTGWNINLVKNPESVADHSFRLAVLTMLYAEKLELDVEKCIKMALVHDMEEVYIGDATPNTKDIENERKGMEKLLNRLSEKESEEILELWEEFNQRKTKEAQLVSDLDKIEMLIQAIQYKKEKRTEKDLYVFFQTTEKIVKTDLGKELLENLRNQYLSIKK